jgi:hypothetical protein
MVHAMQLQFLKVLWLHIGQSLNRHTGPPISFEPLDSLGLRGVNLDDMTTLSSLRTVRSKHITAVFSSCYCPSSEQQSGRMFQFGVILQEKCDKDALEAITLCSEYYKWLTCATK